MKNLNEDELFERLNRGWEDRQVTHAEIISPDYETWGRAREWEYHQTVCLLAGMIPLSKPYFDILISNRSSLDFVHWLTYYPFKPQDQNRLINIDRLLKTLIPDTKLPIQPQAFLAQCKSHMSIAQIIPEPLITVIEQFGPHPSLNLPNVFASLELNPRIFINLKKLEENHKKPQEVIPNAGILARVSPPPKPAESPLAIGKRLYPLKPERWEKVDAFSLNEIILLHYGVDPDDIYRTYAPGEQIDPVAKEYIEYLNHYFHGERQLFVNSLDEQKVIDLLRRSIHTGSLKSFEPGIIPKQEIIEWMQSKNLSFPIHNLSIPEAKGELSKDDLLAYDLKRFDKDQLARFIVKCGAAADWKENPLSSIQKCKKSAVVKEAIRLANLVGKKRKPYSDKVISDWIRDLNPNTNRKNKFFSGSALSYFHPLLKIFTALYLPKRVPLSRAHSPHCPPLHSLFHTSLPLQSLFSSERALFI
ncbi:MAG TPA: hypothetical protein VFU89_01500 [Rhabdochlamydiaceae bacterium]|nr:hypothetical protein [Rhabdochlamydiaceae bacterium]